MSVETKVEVVREVPTVLLDGDVVLDLPLTMKVVMLDGDPIDSAYAKVRRRQRVLICRR